jgi:hypothetical protein
MIWLSCVLTFIAGFIVRGFFLPKKAECLPEVAEQPPPAVEQPRYYYDPATRRLQRR